MSDANPVKRGVTLSLPITARGWMPRGGAN
jgi:hypothetical protein